MKLSLFGAQLAAILTTSCVRAGFDHVDCDGRRPTDLPGTSDHPADRGPSDRTGCTWGSFSGAAPLTEVNSADVDWEPAIAADGLTLYLNSNRAGGKGKGDIWVATRPSVAATFGAPANLAIVNSADHDENPSISTDGNELYLDVVVSGVGHLFVSRRTTSNDPFAAPIALPQPATCAVGPDISHDGLSLYYTRCDLAKDRIALATRSAPGKDLVFARMIDEIGDGGWPSISSDGLELFFESTRTGILRIYVARRQSTAQPFGAPTLVKEIDTPLGTEDAEISADGRTLFYATPAGNGRDIWRATRSCAP